MGNTRVSNQLLASSSVSTAKIAANAVDLATKVTGQLGLANGGTGGTDAATGRTGLGLGSIATQSASSVSISGGAITGTTIDGVSIKSYVDGLVAGLKWKASVRAATTGNGTLATAYENGDTIDGVTLATGDRILLKNQTTQTENGIYIVAASGAPTRATDADTGAELVSAACFVEEGTANADKAFVCTNNTTITLGSTNIAFTGLASVVGALVAANNLSDVANANTAFANISPMTTDGDVIARVSGVPARVAQGSNGTFLGVSGGVLGYYTPPAAPNFAVEETPSGTIDGSNATFTLAHTPTAGSVILYLNGVRLKSGSGNDWTISGSTITMLTGQIPQTGDTLLADYRY